MPTRRPAGRRYELASLYLRLGKLELAQEVLEELLPGVAEAAGSAPRRAGRPDGRQPRAAGEPVALDAAREVGAWRMLSTVLGGRGMHDVALVGLAEARAAQQRAVSAAVAGAPDALAAAREALTELSVELAEAKAALRDDEGAAQLLRETLAQAPRSAAATLALARLHARLGQADAASRLCGALVRLAPDSEAGSLLLADLALQRAAANRPDYEPALFHFQQLLEAAPGRPAPLHRLLLLLRHAGRLSDAPPFLERARAALGTAGERAGVRFCAGVLARWRGDPHAALRELNGARRDSEWGSAAAQAMAEIYIGADSLVDWADTSAEGAPAPGEPQRDNLEAAGRLLAEMKPSRKQARAAAAGVARAFARPRRPRRPRPAGSRLSAARPARAPLSRLARRRRCSAWPPSRSATAPAPRPRSTGCWPRWRRTRSARHRSWRSRSRCSRCGRGPRRART